MWRRCFDRFQVALKMDRDSGQVQVNTLLYTMGREAEVIYDSFVYDDGEDDDYGGEERGRPELDYDMVIAKFSDHFVPKRNVIHERACFHKRAQKPGESVEAFVRSLYEHSSVSLGRPKRSKSETEMSLAYLTTKYHRS